MIFHSFFFSFYLAHISPFFLYTFKTNHASNKHISYFYQKGRYCPFPSVSFFSLFHFFTLSHTFLLSLSLSLFHYTHIHARAHRRVPRSSLNIYLLAWHFIIVYALLYIVSNIIIFFLVTDKYCMLPFFFILYLTLYQDD